LKHVSRKITPDKRVIELTTLDDNIVYFIPLHSTLTIITFHVTKLVKETHRVHSPNELATITLAERRPLANMLIPQIKVRTHNESPSSPSFSRALFALVNPYTFSLLVRQTPPMTLNSAGRLRLSAPNIRHYLEENIECKQEQKNKDNH
jgi:hypothetical protein